VVTKARRKTTTHKKGPTPRRRERTVAAAPADATTASGRYTPPQAAAATFRPGWHKFVGALFLAAGVAIFVLNDLAWFGPTVLPGAHNEGYAVVAFLVAMPSAWWFGWFDRPQGRW